MKRLLILALSLPACQAVPAGGPAPPPATACGIVAASDWTAWVDAMPTVPPSRGGTLIATGKVTVPTGGWTFRWRDMRVMESYPVQVVAELEAIPPAGAATQAVVTREVRGSWPIEPPVGSVAVRCGNMLLARVSPVATAL